MWYKAFQTTVTTRFKWLWSSLDVKEGGASQKKIVTAFLIALTATLEIMFVDRDNVVDLCIINLSTALAFAGIRKVAHFQMKRLDKKKPPVPDDPAYVPDAQKSDLA